MADTTIITAKTVSSTYRMLLFLTVLDVCSTVLSIVYTHIC